MSSYSVDLIKRTAFEDELQNVINLKDNLIPNLFMRHVREYFEDRIKEIDKKYGIEYDSER